jgi:predicted anti-sigma-YlaC factor YlaD
MKAMTCAEVQEQLDLLAAGACDSATRTAIERHMRECPACAARRAESERLVGLLDLQWNQAAVERLQQRIEAAARPQRKRRFAAPFVRSFVAAAAVMLIAAGLLWWLPPWDTDSAASGAQLALVVHARQAVKIDAPVPGRATDKGAEAVAVMPLAAKSGETLRRDLLQAQREGKLPPPPAVSLSMTLVNNGKRPVEVRLGDVVPMLSLDVDGNGVVRMPVPEGQAVDFPERQSWQLQPGAQHDITIGRLMAGSPGAIEYIYLTEPGEVTVTARLRLSVDGEPVTVTAAPVHIKAGDH